MTDDSGLGRKSVTFNHNGRSRSAGTAGHVQTESAVKFVRNTQLSLILREPRSTSKPRGALIGASERPRIVPLDQRMSTADVLRIVGVNRSTLFRWTKKG